MLKDIVRVADSGFASLRGKLGKAIAGRSWESERSVVHVQGWVRSVMRERGKIVPGSHRDGHNIWTNVGREYLAMLMSASSLSPTTTYFRSDRVMYIGVGTGSQIEEANVIGLVNPVAVEGTTFLAEVEAPPTFPLSPSRTTVRFARSFSTGQITTSATPVVISELGLFTDGNQSTFEAGARDLFMTGASSQSPVAYKTFEPIEKTNNLVFDIEWEIRF